MPALPASDSFFVEKNLENTQPQKRHGQKMMQPANAWLQHALQAVAVLRPSEVWFFCVEVISKLQMFRTEWTHFCCFAANFLNAWKNSVGMCLQMNASKNLIKWFLKPQVESTTETRFWAMGDENAQKINHEGHMGGIKTEDSLTKPFSRWLSKSFSRWCLFRLWDAHLSWPEGVCCGLDMSHFSCFVSNTVVVEITTMITCTSRHNTEVTQFQTRLILAHIKCLKWVLQMIGLADWFCSAVSAEGFSGDVPWMQMCLCSAHAASVLPRKKPQDLEFCPKQGGACIGTFPATRHHHVHFQQV